MRLELLDFVRQNQDWEARLADSPYFVKTKRDGRFVLLKYDQIRSDFNLALVRECRGIILDETANYQPVCVPFMKFGNIGESYVPKIEWGTAKVQEKLDGSLIKLWNYQDQWHVSSNGEIDARNAHIDSALLTGASRSNLFELFMEAWEKTGQTMESLNSRYTYLFELTSPHNRVVVRHTQTTIRHIGTRDNITLEELDTDIGIPKPRTFNLRTVEECLENVRALGSDDEGYVVVDRDFNRIKIKSPRYVALAHMALGVTTRGNVTEIIQRNEQAEVLTYFPEYQGVFDEILQGIDGFCARQEADLAQLQAMTFATRKDLAAVVTKMECPPCLFSLMDGKVASARDWLLSRSPSKLLEYVDRLTG
ncbi:MAG: T4 RnlA family RNA ligase [Propionibacteriaceae bacterium]|jgi:hypothetical protein|nr:T4 RnlA family RNA ligase [Propionibacteriaceae bacterium]